MFFKVLFSIFFLISFSFPVFGLIENSTCLKEMKSYYPYLKTGQLKLEKQERFFRCVHDSLELIVVNKIFIHDPSRDYFTKKEMFKMFHVHFELEKDLSQDLVDNLFLIKHLIVGGERQQLRDEELKTIYELVNVYADFYYIIHKRIGVINKILHPEQRGEVSEKEFQFTLSKLEEAFRFLSQSYQEKGVTYRVSDLDHLFSYLEDYNQSTPGWKKYAQFLKLWVKGFLLPKTFIKESSWDYFFKSSHKMISMFLYYKRYALEQNLSQPEILARVLKSLEYFVSSLSFVESSPQKRGFPIKNIDEMLSIMVSLSKDQVQQFDNLRIFTNKKANPIPLFTRSLVCFVFKTKHSKDCSYKVGQRNFLSIEYHFPDGTFQFYRDQQKWLPNQGVDFEVTPSQLESIQNWLSDYVVGYERLFQHQIKPVSDFYKFDHWLESSFGEVEGDSRILFYTFFSSPTTYRALPYRLLNYRFLSDLFLTPYKKEGKVYNLSSKDWKSVVDEVLPVLLAFEKEGYDFSLRKQLIGLFDYADHFLNSSNSDKSLDSKEVLDLIVHIMSARENSQYAYNKLIQSCSDVLEVSCVGDHLFEKDIMKPFPRLQSYLTNYDSNEYQLSTKKLLKGRSALTKPSDLMDVFLIIQMLEVQFHLNDRNRDVRLESQEVFQVVKKFSDQIVQSIPYIRESSQSRSFLMYSFKTGSIPFLQEEGQTFSSLKFFDWHINHKDEPFHITKGSLYSTTLKFYTLYRNHF